MSASHVPFVFPQHAYDAGKDGTCAVFEFSEYGVVTRCGKDEKDEIHEVARLKLYISQLEITIFNQNLRIEEFERPPVGGYLDRMFREGRNAIASTEDHG